MPGFDCFTDPVTPLEWSGVASQGMSSTADRLGRLATLTGAASDPEGGRGRVDTWLVTVHLVRGRRPRVASMTDLEGCGMPVVEESVLIAQRPDVVFDYLIRVENLPAWDASVLEAEQVGTEPVGVGSRFHGSAKILGRRFEWTTELIECDPPRRASFRSVEGKLKFTATNILDPVGEGTRFTYRVEAESGFGGIFGRLADPIVARAQARSVRADLETLADVLAEQPPA